MILRRKNKSYLALGLILILLVGLSLIALRFLQRQGTETPEELLDHYVLAIRQENPNQLLNLLPNTHTITQAELRKIIENSGGKELEQFQISYLPSESPQLTIVKLTGTYKKNLKSFKFTDTLYLQRIADRWFLLLGRAKNGIPIAAPSSKIE